MYIVKLETWRMIQTKSGNISHIFISSLSYKCKLKPTSPKEGEKNECGRSCSLQTFNIKLRKQTQTTFCLCSQYSDSNNEWYMFYISVWLFRLLRLCMCTHVSLRVYRPASHTYCCMSWWNTDTLDRKLIMSTQKLSDRHTAVTL